MKALPTYSRHGDVQRIWKRAFKAIGKKESIRVLCPLVHDYLNIFDKFDHLPQAYQNNRDSFYRALEELSAGTPGYHCKVLREIIERWDEYHFTDFAYTRPAFDLLMINDAPTDFEKYTSNILSSADGVDLNLSAIQQEVTKLISDH